MGWKKEVLLTTEERVDKIKSLSARKKKFSYDVEFEKGDNGSYYNKFLQVGQGDLVSYQIEKAELTSDENPEDKFSVNSVINMSLYTDSSEPVPIDSLKSVKENSLMFIDIETVAQTNRLTKGPLFDSWKYKNRNDENLKTEKDFRDLFYEKAPLYAEFGKIVCISIGMINKGDLVVKSFAGEDEEEILKDFSELLNKAKGVTLCGYSIKDFDVPFLFRRMMINGIQVPKVLDISGKKPWEVKGLVDLKEVWKGPSWYTASMLNLAVAFGLESPKGVMDGSEVSKVFYSKDEDRVQKIEEYCEGDVKCTANLFRKMTYKPIFENYVKRDGAKKE